MPDFPSTPEPDLFSLSAGDEAGYERWRAEGEAARNVGLLSGESAGELPVAADGAGYERFRADMAEARLAFERQWGVPAGHRVRVVLRDGDREHEGILRVVESIAPTKKLGLMLQVGGHAFRAAEVLSVVRAGI